MKFKETDARVPLPRRHQVDDETFGFKFPIEPEPSDSGDTPSPAGRTKEQQPHSGSPAQRSSKGSASTRRSTSRKKSPGSSGTPSRTPDDHGAGPRSQSSES